MIKVRLVTEFNNIPLLTAQMQAKAVGAVAVAAFNVSARVKQSMGPPKSGREYPRPGGRTHQASAPGEAPAIDYGNLVNSIQVDFENGGLTGVVFTSRDYAAGLEFGTAHVAPRPFMEPAAAAEWPLFQAAMKKAVGG
jgi:hypothetical protein